MSFEQVAEDRVVLEQMSESGRARQIIDGDKFDFRIAERGAQNVAANPAEAVDANLHCHGEFSFVRFEKSVKS